MLKKEDVEALLQVLGDRQYHLTVVVTESDAEKTLEQVQQVGFARYLTTAPGKPFEVVVVERVKS